MKHLFLFLTSTVLVFGAAPSHAHFGDFLNKIKDKANEEVSKAVNEATDKGKGRNSDKSDNQSGNASPDSKPSGPTTVNGQPNLAAGKIDFVAGEKTIFYDDFSDMPPSEPPPHWKVRDGHVDLLMGSGIRALSIPSGVNLTSESMQIPKDFTFQVVFMPKPGFNDASGFLGFSFRNSNDNELLGGTINVKYTSVALSNNLGSVPVNWNFSKPNEFDLWVQQGRVRAYVNGERVIDVNQVKVGPLDHLYLQESQGTFELRSVRIAQSSPDPGSVLARTGKYVTHGILFDTDSAVLKPQSAGVMKEISTALYKHPDMKLEIDGFTDSTGNAAHNLDLSKRRAQTVMNVLVSQFGIDQSRLKTNGFGQDKPISSNATPEGRANNRRVEFVKL